MMPDRRAGVTVTLKHPPGESVPGNEFDITFNQHPETRRFEECFYAAPNRIDVGKARVKYGSDLQALIVDACISISKRLEHGESFAEVSGSLGENRAPGAASGAPASLLGTIARMGAALDAEGIYLYEKEGEAPKC